MTDNDNNYNAESRNACISNIKTVKMADIYKWSNTKRNEKRTSMCMHTRTSMLNDPLPPRPMSHCLGHVIIPNLLCFYNNMAIQQFNIIKSILLRIWHTWFLLFK